MISLFTSSRIGSVTVLILTHCARTGQLNPLRHTASTPDSEPAEHPRPRAGHPLDPARGGLTGRSHGGSSDRPGAAHWGAVDSFSVEPPKNRGETMFQMT